MPSITATRRRVLVTGASSGLGREIAVQSARSGARVAVTGRREDRLREVALAIETAGGEALALAGDVTDFRDVQRQYAVIRDRWKGLDWAILNAGVSERVSARQFKAATFRRVFETNIFGVANWLEAVLPDMIAAGRGTVAGVASLAGFRGLPGHGVYCASKAALITLLESARIDLRGSGVHVVTLCPGFVKTELTASRDPKSMPFLMEVEDAARAMIGGIEKKRRVAHFPWQLSYLAKYVLPSIPDAIYERMAGFAAPYRKTEDPAHF